MKTSETNQSAMLRTTHNLTCLSLLAAISIFMIGSSSRATAGFHLWEISEVYSSADGSVQFVELTAQLGGQQFMSFGASITSTNSAGASTVSCTTNLPSDTTGKTCIFGTANLASIPGGVVPNYIIPPNFIRRPTGGGNAAVIFNPLPSTVVCNPLPADGSGALLRVAGVMTVVPTNSPKNFAGQSNSIVPVKIDTGTVNTGNFVLTFATASGPNGTTGSNYAVEANNTISPASWTTISNVTGNGTIKTVAVPFSPGSNQFFRLRSP